MDVFRELPLKLVVVLLLPLLVVIPAIIARKTFPLSPVVSDLL